MALFKNVDTLIPWFLPISLFVSFVQRTLDAPLHIYNTMRQVVFGMIETHFTELIHTDPVTGARYVPRQLIDQFLKGKLTKILYTSFMDFVSLLGLTILLVLVMLGMQLPKETLAGSTGSVLGMELVFFMPYITKYINKEASEIGGL